jgi:hypothetical protein
LWLADGASFYLNPPQNSQEKSPMPSKLKNGVIGCPGGARKNAGRKPDWFKLQCQQILSSKKFLDFCQNVIDGNDITQAGAFGPVTAPATIKDRIRAAEFLRDSGFGKPAQAVALTDTNGADLSAVLTLTAQARSERGLDD